MVHLWRQWWIYSGVICGCVFVLSLISVRIFVSAFVPSYESLYYTSLRTRVIVVWAKWMEYRWPVDVVFSSKKTFEVVGLAEAALS